MRPNPWNRVFTFMFLLAFMAGMIFPATAVAAPIAAEPAAPATQADALAKIEPLVLEEIAANGETEFFVWMTTKADLTPAKSLATKLEKGQFVYETLRATADSSQRALRAELDAQGVKYRPFYIANKIFIEAGNQELVMSLAARSDVASITPNRQFQLDEPIINPRPPVNPEAIEPNIDFIRAPLVWGLGFTGEGMVLAGNDTGLVWNHPAIINQYRGWNGSTADHNYNWWDATATYPMVPGDGNGHGTHTTGTMVGDDGGDNQIGVAPGAKTIHCKNMTDAGSGSDLTFSTCFEWDLAPWDLNQQNPMPSLAPHAVNNSWGYWGGGAPQFIDEIDALQAAGIVVEVSAGNEGPSCSTLRSPGDYAQVMTTGSVNHAGGVLPGTLTGFSSRGPSALHSGFFPDIMAPGQNIRSSVGSSGYQTSSGTSMSGPHATALIALMWQAAPGFEGMVEETYDIIHSTAVPLTGVTGSNCGGDYTTGPNNDWGFGTIDALAAVEEAMSLDTPYRFVITPASQDVCYPANFDYDVDVIQNDPMFTDPVTLSAIGYPGGYVASFDPNPVVPPGMSLFELTNSGATTPGSYAIDVVGVAVTYTVTSTVTANMFTETPGAITLTAPADGASNIDLRPTFQWTAATQGGSYYLEVATDAGFVDIVYTATVTGTMHQATAVLNPLTEYFWQVTPSNACGDGATSATWSFTTRDIPPILLVDDDDNSPDVRSYYTTALDNLGLFYDVWDTNNSDNEPSAAELAPYQAVIWFTGDSFGGSAGPGAAGEAALATWLDAGACLFISSQDYLFDRGLTSFMQNYLGVASFSNDVGQVTVTGAGSVFSGLGPYSLVYPFSNWSDIISPDGTAELAFTGNQGDAAVNKDGGAYQTSFWGFPFEALPNDLAREDTLTALIDWCGVGGDTGWLAGTVTDGDTDEPIAGATVEAGGRSVETNAMGMYQMRLPVGIYDVTASATNYMPVTETDVEILLDETTTVDFELFGSILTYSPDFITETMQFGDVVSNTVTLTNTGPLDIDFNVVIGNYGGPSVTVVARPPHLVSPAEANFSAAAPVGPTSARSPEGQATLAEINEPLAWLNGAPMPTGLVRYAHAQCDEQPDSYYVISGVDPGFAITNGAWRYNADSDTWDTLAPIPVGQEGPSAVCYGGNIYVAGGGGTNQFYVYNVAGNSWSAAPALPRMVWGAAMGAYDGKVYMIGGDSDFSFGGTSNQVNIYDIAAGTWSTGAPMPTAAVTAGSGQAGQFVYVVGGWGDASPGSNVNATQRYDMSANTWELGPTFTSARADHALAITSSNLYAIAGDANGGGPFDPTNLVESLDHTAWPGGAWTNIADPLPQALTAINGGFCTNAVTGGEVWAPGGFDGATVSNGNRYRAAEACFSGAGTWASADPSSGTVPANSTATFDVIFDASSLFQTGTYTAMLDFNGTFVNDPPPMPLTMILGCDDCGFLEGEIFDDWTGDPLSASIHITGPGGFDVTLSGNSYSLAVQPGSYDFTVSAAGYFDATDTVVAVQGVTTVTDFYMVPMDALLEYTPPFITEDMEVGADRQQHGNGHQHRHGAARVLGTYPRLRWPNGCQCAAGIDPSLYG
jgi:subtilisin family serine protease